MLHVVIVSSEAEPVSGLRSALPERGVECAVVPSFDPSAGNGPKPNLVSVCINGASPGTGLWRLPQKIRAETGLPVLGLISRAALPHGDTLADFDDFVLEPWDPGEVAVRMRRLALRRHGTSEGEIIRCGGLVIDPARCEVFLNDRRIELTFREYELLKFLASNPGRAFTRETLLNKVWGFDYFGGDRTVDVHVRRLRSKLGGPDETFIETVRNIGYRFRR